jgi:hypothetical protein
MNISPINKNDQPSFGMASQLSRAMRTTMKNLTDIGETEGVYNLLHYLDQNLGGFDFRFLRSESLFGKKVNIDVFTRTTCDQFGNIIDHSRKLGTVPTSIHQITKKPRRLIERIGSTIEGGRYDANKRPSEFFATLKDYIDRSFGDIPTTQYRK